MRTSVGLTWVLGVLGTLLNTWYSAPGEIKKLLFFREYFVLSFVRVLLPRLLPPFAKVLTYGPPTRQTL